jgi:uncharacterized membrane protein YhaH (DUF805 family)
MGDMIGRSSRAEFWWFVAFIALVRFGLSLLDQYVFAPRLLDNPTRDFSITTFLTYAPLYTLFGLITALPFVAVLIRRLHDMGRSGWWGGAWLLFFMVVQFIAAVQMQSTTTPWASEEPLVFALSAGMVIWLIVLVVFLLSPTEPKSNKYGDPPRS